MLIDNEVPNDRIRHGEELPLVAPGETLHAYLYGGFLSERAGWYTTPEDDPTKILRSKGTWMS